MNLIGIDQPFCVDGQVGNVDPALLQSLAGIQNSVMLDLRCDYMLASLDDAEDRKIIGFGASAGKDDFCRATAKESRYRLPGALDGGPGVLPVMVDGRSVPELVQIVRAHCLKDLGQNRRGRIAIEVNALHVGILNV